MPNASYTLEASWEGVNVGTLTVGFSVVGGTDIVGPTFTSRFDGAYDDLTAYLKSVSWSRGRTDAIGQATAGSASIVLTDPDGIFNPANPSSPLAGLLKPMRPIRLQSSYLIADDPGGDFQRLVLDAHPSVYYRLDEPSGGTLADSSGNDNDASVFGVAFTYARPGLLVGDTDTALKINGGTTNGASFALGLTAGAYTIECLVKRNAAGHRDPLLWIGTFATGVGLYLYIDTDDRVKFAQGSDASGAGVGVLLTSNVTIADTATHFIQLSGNGRLFVDSVLVAALGSDAPGLVFSLATLGAACFGSATVASCNATLDEFAIYPSAQTDDQMAARWNASRVHSATRGCFYHFIRSIEHNPDRDVQETTIETIDLFEWLSHYSPALADEGIESVGSAIERILDAILWTDPTLRQIAVGDDIVGFSSDGTVTALDLVLSTLLAIDPGGIFFIDGNGVPTYLDRHAILNEAAAATITDSMTTVTPGTSSDNISNRFAVTVGDGDPQTATNDTSVEDYAIRDGASVSTDLLASDAVGLELATELARLYGIPDQPARDLGLVNGTVAQLAQILTLEVGDRVSVSESSGGTSGEYVIQQINHEVTDAGLVHRASYALTVADDQNPIIVGSSVVGGSGVLIY